MSNREETLDPQGQRELEALERGLAGAPVAADLAEWAELARMLAGERPRPRDEWVRQIDDRVARRFRPSGTTSGTEAGEARNSGAEGGGARGLRSVAARLADAFAGRSLAPIGGAAVLLVVVAVAASSLSGGDGGRSGATSGVPEVASDVAVREDRLANGSAPGPARTSAPDTGAGGLSGPSAQASRHVQRDAQLTLSTDPGRVRDVADDVIAATRSLDGIVASSRVTERGQRASASLALTVPAASLGAALDRLTSLAHVESMSEGALDITRSVDSARDRLRDARAERARLLEALGSVSGEEEIVELRKQIAAARRRAARARAQVADTTRRARYAQISVTVRGAGRSGAERSLSDWLERALDVIRALAGVLLVSAAILIPLALLAALAWLIGGALLRRRRERALDDQPS